MRKIILGSLVFFLLIGACSDLDESSLDANAHRSERPVSGTDIRPFDPLSIVKPALQATLPPDRLGQSRDIAETVRMVDGVKAVARVNLDVVSTEGNDGKSDITVVAVDPDEFRPLAPSTTGNADFVWRGLQGRQIYLAHEEYARLGVQPGENVYLKGPRSSLLFRIGGVAANGVPNLAGALISHQHADALGLGPPNLLLVGLQGGQDRNTVLKGIAERLPRFRFDPMAAASNHAFVTGKAAAALFGSFDYTVNPDGTINPTQAWVKKYIVAGTVPILGSTKCHRVMFSQLKGALAEVEEAGFASLINVKDYGGCYNARLIRGEDPNDPAAHRHLSMHAWGLAVDMNVSTNQMGAQPTMDPRIVEIFERWGYRWGGRWSRPDGMHFEMAAILKELLPTQRPRRR